MPMKITISNVQVSLSDPALHPMRDGQAELLVNGWVLMLQAGRKTPRTDGEQTPRLPSIEDCCSQQERAFNVESSDITGMHSRTVHSADWWRQTSGSRKRSRNSFTLFTLFSQQLYFSAHSRKWLKRQSFQPTNSLKTVVQLHNKINNLNTQMSIIRLAPTVVHPWWGRRVPEEEEGGANKIAVWHFFASLYLSNQNSILPSPAVSPWLFHVN